MAGLALLGAACGTESPNPSLGSSVATSTLAPGSPDPSPSRAIELLAPPALEPEDIRLSCGSPLPFGAEALGGARSAEQADHPAAAALRKLLRESSLPRRGGWQVVVLSDTSALFLLPEPRDREAPFWSAEFENQAGTWNYVRSGQCALQPIFEDLEAASWQLAPGQQITPETRTFDVLVTASGCSSGERPDGRIAPAAAIYQETSVTVIFGARPLPGAQTCQSAPPAMVTLRLDEPLGDRQLLDGSVFPAELRGGPP